MNNLFCFNIIGYKTLKNIIKVINQSDTNGQYYHEVLFFRFTL
jgi:hypothetical protein